MESSHRSLSRAVRLALGGVMIAFAWLVLSVVFGLSSGHAHADDASENGGALSSLTGAVDSMVDTAVVGIVGGVADTAASVVHSTVSTLTTAAPVTAPVVDTVTETVWAVTEPVQEIVSAGVVSDVVTPVVDVVAAVPVVGQVASDLGVNRALTDVADTADGAAQSLIGAVTTTIPDAVDRPVRSGLPGLVTDVAAAFLVGGAFIGSVVAAAPATFFSADSSPALSATSGSLGGTTAEPRSASSSTPAPFSPSAPCGPLGESSLGSGNAGAGAGALLALGPLVAHRAWVRRRGHQNDQAPLAPASSTDVSPD